MTCAPGDLCTCGCCEPVGRATPLEIWNRPGLDRIAYRVGTYESFRRSMLEAIATTPELTLWTSRDDTDYGIALLSMWAYVGDILTFYGERAIQEAFLATAIDDRSLRRLAGLLDYLPAPGSAATAFLAFTAEAGKRFEVRPGQRVQSVPAQDESPQKFEPIETVAVEPALDRVPALPKPEPAAALAKGSRTVTLAPALAAQGPALVPGDRLVTLSAGAIEEKVVESLASPDWRTLLAFRPAMHAGGSALFKWRRKFRLFGHNAPDPWLEPRVTSTGRITFHSTSLSFGVSGSILDLDGVYDLGPGSEVLVAAGGGPAKAGHFTVQAVETAAGQLGPLAGAVTRLHLDGDVADASAPVDRRTVTVYELVAAAPGVVEIPLWSGAYAAEIPLGAATVYVRADAPDELPGVEKGRRLILADAAGAARPVTATGPPALQSVAGVKHLAISFDPPLDLALQAAGAELRGNVARATHGETVRDEVLGSGDASRTFQRFTLAKPFVTHVPDAHAEHGAASTLEVEVNGVTWHEVRDFYGRSGDERVFVTRVDEKGRMSVRFGDGLTGARVETGKNNLTATYRHGLGLAGRVAAGALRTALDRPRGLKAVVNPGPAYGGSAPELGARTREDAPNVVRTFGRIVSLRDFEDAAREYAGVAKARAVERWRGEVREVCLFVAGDAGAALGSNGLADLHAFLDARRDPHRLLRVQDSTSLPLAMVLSVAVDPDHDEDAVRDAVTGALAAHFDFAARDLGEPARLSDLYRVVQGVPGILGADFQRLFFKAPSTVPHLDRRNLRLRGGGYDPLQPRLLLFADELAVIEDPGTDLDVRPGLGPETAT